MPDLFNCHGNDQAMCNWRYEDGSGYVLLENHCHGGGNVTASLDIHWQHHTFPADETAAIAYVRGLTVPIYHDQDQPGTNPTAERAAFQGQPAWRVTGQWKTTWQSSGAVYGGPIEWVIFRCPDPASDWLWTLVISSNEGAYMDKLRVLRETFECPRKEILP